MTKRFILALLLLCCAPAWGQQVTVSPQQFNATWLPALAFGGASVGVTYTTQVGEYTAIGNMVCVQAYIVISSKGSSTGSATLSLPIATKANTEFIGIATTTGLTFTGTLQAYNNANTAVVNIAVGNNGTFSALSNTGFSNVSDLSINGCYFSS